MDRWETGTNFGRAVLAPDDQPQALLKDRPPLHRHGLEDLLLHPAHLRHDRLQQLHRLGRGATGVRARVPLGAAELEQAAVDQALDHLGERVLVDAGQRAELGLAGLGVLANRDEEGDLLARRTVGPERRREQLLGPLVAAPQEVTRRVAEREGLDAVVRTGSDLYGVRFIA